MTLDTIGFQGIEADPIDMIESLAHAKDLDAQRVDDTEVHLCLAGSWRDISLWFSWREEAGVLQVGAPLEIKVPPIRKPEVLKLMAQINERLWLGHFDLWEEDGSLVYRNGAVLEPGHGISAGQAEALLRGARDAFEQFYPAFNYVVWGGKDASEAIAAAVLQPAGTA
ncbi:YbjN domain-containing protein [Parvularcula maris]|uniref:YbjN domain-containing protein n=1 Tax=Parvularcula maris TaxID=2965077 RepID=A0A9X2L8H5_9PROT|nr:YbjN domain-containing protein [Parvularcula maris]MCQ8185031.1 YbjN domain-containing protein [Parvularcula maris]